MLPLSAFGLAIETVVRLISDNPQTTVLILMAFGAYYEIHHGRLDQMARKQDLLGLAVYMLLQKHDKEAAESFRDDLHGSGGGGYHPGDWFEWDTEDDD